MLLHYSNNVTACAPIVMLKTCRKSLAALNQFRRLFQHTSATNVINFKAVNTNPNEMRLKKKTPFHHFTSLWMKDRLIYEKRKMRIEKLQ